MSHAEIHHTSETPWKTNDDAGRRDVLERLALDRLVHGGGVVVIGLDAVRDRLGARWPAKRELVWEWIERRFERRAHPTDTCARLSDVELLLATNDGPRAALGRGLDLLQALLDFFVGEHGPADLKIAQAVSAGRGAVALESMTPADILAAAHAAAAAPSAPPAVRALKAAPVATSAPASLAKSASFLSADGRRIEVRFEFDPVFNLGVGASTAAATAIRPIVWERGGRGDLGSNWRPELPFADVLRIDKAVLEVARILSARTANGQAGAVIVPLSLDVLLSGRGAAAVLQGFAAIGPAVGARLVGEIVGVDHGTPPGHLDEAMALLKRHCKGVLVRGAPNRGCMEVLKICKPLAISLDCEGLPSDYEALAAAMWSFFKSARPICRRVMMLGLPNMEACRLAAAVGATQASVRADAESQRREHAA